MKAVFETAFFVFETAPFFQKISIPSFASRIGRSGFGSARKLVGANGRCFPEIPFLPGTSIFSLSKISVYCIL